jgi:magnesium transporter
MNTIQTITTKNFTWVNVLKPEERQIEYLKKKFHFHSLDLKDCLPPLQRPKLEIRSNYLFMILLFPVYNRQTKAVFSSEVDFFISENCLVTVHSNELSPLINLFEMAQEKSFQEKYLSGSSGILLYEILNSLLLYCFPILNHISLNIDEAEKQIFAGYEKKMVEEILIIKRNIINFRKAMQAHENVMKKLIAQAPQFFSIAKLSIYFDSLVEHTKEIWDFLENYKEAINALHETNESLISFRLNDIMKFLTIISVVLLPVFLIANILGMNMPLPFLEGANAFWVVLSGMLVVFWGMIWYFRRKGWT